MRSTMVKRSTGIVFFAVTTILASCSGGSSGLPSGDPSTNPVGPVQDVPQPNIPGQTPDVVPGDLPQSSDLPDENEVIMDPARIAMSFDTSEPYRKWTCFSLSTGDFFEFELTGLPNEDGPTNGSAHFFFPQPELGAIVSSGEPEVFPADLVFMQTAFDEAALMFPAASAQDTWAGFSFRHDSGRRTVNFDSSVFGQMQCDDQDPPELPNVSPNPTPVTPDPVEPDPVEVVVPENPPINPDLEYRGDILWELTHACSTVITPGPRVLEIPIDVRFFEILNDVRTGKTWPSDPSLVYKLDSPSIITNTRFFETVCAYPTQVCWGAAVTKENGERWTWALGIDGVDSCTDCCISCPQFGGSKRADIEPLSCR